MSTLIEEFEIKAYSKTILSFWVYLMTDCLLFTTLFATYVVLHNETFGGPTSVEIFKIRSAFIETCLLLSSSISCGLGVLKFFEMKKKWVIIWFLITFILGASFVGHELNEFLNLLKKGQGPSRSAFLSAYFTLVGTHGLHVTTALFWLIILMGQLFVKSLTAETFRRFVLFSLFWHFLDIVWVFIFTIVYLLGIGT